MPEELLKPDLCVIGAGSAGLSLAAIAASFGVSVVLIEQGRMGGECLNVGCIPSKTLIALAKRHSIKNDGAVFPESTDYTAIRRHIRQVVASIAPNDSIARFSALGVRVIEARAQFIERTTVRAGNFIIKARRFILATGSRPAMPSIPGLETIDPLTNETVFDLEERPRHLVVIGGGPSGVEIAQAHRLLGTQVSLVEAGPRILPREDSEMSAVVERALLQSGVDLWTGTVIERAESRAGGFALFLKGRAEIIEGSHCLIAVGRQAFTENLGLETASVGVDQTGIIVDKSLKTSNRSIYAIGDCAGGAATGYRFTHVANYHAGMVVRNALFRLPVAIDMSTIARVTFTDPELASIGLSEEDARAKYGTIRILRWPFSENDRAQTEGETKGHAKAIVTSRGRILGCAIVGPQAGELILPWALAMKKRLKIQDLADLVFPYPTLSEISKRVAVEHIRPGAQNPAVRGLIKFLSRFG